MAKRYGEIMGQLLLENISKSFIRPDSASIMQVLKDVDLSINEGEFVCIVGPSGSGKSTLLRIIAGLLNPTIGSVVLDGKNITGTTDSNRGMVFQDPTLFPWLTVKDNVDFSGAVQGNKKSGRAEELIELVGLNGFENSYPHQLSGGMAQRVAIIRTMIHEPELFLLDEPLGALDAFTRINMQEEILRIWQQNKHTMIMITHDVDEAIVMSNRVVILSANPGTIKNVIEIDLPYPRNRTDDNFNAYRNQIMEELNIT